MGGKRYDNDVSDLPGDIPFKTAVDASGAFNPASAQYANDFNRGVRETLRTGGELAQARLADQAANNPAELEGIKAATDYIAKHPDFKPSKP